MRLRVRCGPQYTLGDLQWCMVHVPEHLRTCGDLLGHIVKLLELEDRGGDGDLPLLLLDGFLVPHTEEVRAVLHDDEVVDVVQRAAFVRPTQQTGAKRPLQLANGTSPAPGSNDLAQASKRQRGGFVLAEAAPGSAAEKAQAQQQAIGWQSPEASPTLRATPKKDTKPAVTPAQSRSVASKAPAGAGEKSSSESSSSEDAPPPKVTKTALAKEPAQERREVVADASSSESLGLFVGGLPWSVDDARLAKHFASFGNVVSAMVVMNNNTGKSKGFGFVEFSDVGSVVKAMAAGAQQELEGRTIEVKAREGKAKGKDKGKDKGKGKGKGKDKGKDKGKRKASDTPAIADFDRAGGQAAAGASESSDSDERIPSTSSAAAAAARAKLAAAATNRALEVSELAATPGAATGVAAKRKKNAPADQEEELDEETKQMIALGLPVSFKANEDKQTSDEEEEEEDEDE